MYVQTATNTGPLRSVNVHLGGVSSLAKELEGVKVVDGKLKVCSEIQFSIHYSGWFFQGH